MLLGFLRRSHSAKQPTASGDLDNKKLSEDSAYAEASPAPQRRASNPDAGQTSEQHLASLHLGGTSATLPGEPPPAVPENAGLRASDFPRKTGASSAGSMQREARRAGRHDHLEANTWVSDMCIECLALLGAQTAGPATTRPWCTAATAAASA
jgi:hypothetical protein